MLLVASKCFSQVADGFVGGLLRVGKGSDEHVALHRGRHMIAVGRHHREITHGVCRHHVRLHAVGHGRLSIAGSGDTPAFRHREAHMPVGACIQERVADRRVGVNAPCAVIVQGSRREYVAQCDHAVVTAETAGAFGNLHGVGQRQGHGSIRLPCAVNGHGKHGLRIIQPSVHGNGAVHARTGQRQAAGAELARIAGVEHLLRCGGGRFLREVCAGVAAQDDSRLRFAGAVGQRHRLRGRKGQGIGVEHGVDADIIHTGGCGDDSLTLGRQHGGRLPQRPCGYPQAECGSGSHAQHNQPCKAAGAALIIPREDGFALGFSFQKHVPPGSCRPCAQLPTIASYYYTTKQHDIQQQKMEGNQPFRPCFFRHSRQRSATVAPVQSISA